MGFNNVLLSNVFLRGAATCGLQGANKKVNRMVHYQGKFWPFVGKEVDMSVLF
jgi:hypothetical protein